jgi:hypothetical protein
MSRLFLIALFAFVSAACSNDSVLDRADAAPLKPAEVKPEPPRNLICERVALENPKLQCTPELTDAGELHTHTARLLIDGQHVVCAVNSSQVSAVCGPMFVAPQQAPQAQQPQPKPKAKWADDVKTKAPPKK